MPRVFVGSPERKRPLGRPRHRWEDNIIYVRVVEREGVDWIHMAEDVEK
jgi:hypothetical protein